MKDKHEADYTPLGPNDPLWDDLPAEDKADPMYDRHGNAGDFGGFYASPGYGTDDDDADPFGPLPPEELTDCRGTFIFPCGGCDACVTHGLADLCED